MPKFRKKPVVIEAVQLDHSPSSAAEIIEWANSHSCTIACEHDGGESHQLSIPTLEGTMTASVGDWVIRGIKGEFYPCKPDIFEATYSAADDDPASDVHRLRTDAFCAGARWFDGTMGPVASKITVNEAAQRYADSFLANKAA